MHYVHKHLCGVTAATYQPPPTGIPCSPTPSCSSHVVDDPAIVIAQSLKLPRVEISKFLGDPKDYRRFKVDFNSNIAKYSTDDGYSYNCLKKFTSGSAHKIVEGAWSGDPGISYTTAWQFLEETYGASYHVVSSVVTDLKEHLPASDGIDLVLFANKILTSIQYLEDSGILSTVESQEFIGILMEKNSQIFATQVQSLCCKIFVWS